MEDSKLFTTGFYQDIYMWYSQDSFDRYLSYVRRGNLIIQKWSVYILQSFFSLSNTKVKEHMQKQALQYIAEGEELQDITQYQQSISV